MITKKPQHTFQNLPSKIWLRIHVWSSSSHRRHRHHRCYLVLINGRLCRMSVLDYRALPPPLPAPFISPYFFGVWGKGEGEVVVVVVVKEEEPKIRRLKCVCVCVCVCVIQAVL
ncbi:hypothetical protein E2C01_007405 [Portunus trituberculatus]|uniref:Uncharacterized protein n=1 Tax=Portunus trituberculatus TaxID=210409 RepID=A0A5B7D034_PORTR|nr:hypothetical protein [Portunus trituberculatus]